jgi:aldose 1-epimerase
MSLFVTLFSTFSAFFASFSIANGTFQLNGRDYSLAVNNGPNALHGGLHGFDQKEWSVEEASETAVTLQYVSPDGEEGYPGRLVTRVTYSVKDGNRLCLDYSSTCDSDCATLCSLTNHSYFNLSGGHEATIHEHTVQLIDRRYLELNEVQIPTGKVLEAMQGSGMDLCVEGGTRLGDAMEKAKLNTGFDHCYVTGANGLTLSAIVRCPCSKVSMCFYTTEPGFQLYTGYYVDCAQDGGKSSQPAEFRHYRFSGLCLEAQRFPDAINQEKWKEQVVLRPGQVYKQSTVYEFQYE